MIRESSQLSRVAHARPLPRMFRGSLPAVDPQAVCLRDYCHCSVPRTIDPCGWQGHICVSTRELVSSLPIVPRLAFRALFSALPVNLCNILQQWDNHTCTDTHTHTQTRAHREIVNLSVACETQKQLRDYLPSILAENCLFMALAMQFHV